MKRQIVKILDLRNLLIELDDIPEIESALEQFGRAYYSDLFLANARYGFHSLHDGDQVRFAAGRFKHAFSKADNWQSSTKKTSFDKRRIARVKWILPVIQGYVSGIECWLVTENGEEKRLYVNFGQGYVVWLESTGDGEWEFSTAYTADQRRIREYVRGGRKIWKFGQ